MRYDSTYSALVALNEKMGGVQSPPISEYDAVTNLMSTMSGGEVDVNDPVAAVEQVVVKAENNELPIQSGCKLKTLNVTNNGVYNADETFNGWKKVIVNVPNPFDKPRVELVSSTYVDNHTSFSFTIRMSEGYPWYISGWGCPWFDLSNEYKWIDNGDDTYTYNINIEETGICGEETSYLYISEVNIDRIYNDVLIRFTYPVDTRIEFN